MTTESTKNSITIVELFFIIFSFFLWFGCFEFQRLLVLSAPRNSRRLNVIVVVVVAAGSRVVVMVADVAVVFALLLLSLLQAACKCA